MKKINDQELTELKAQGMEQKKIAEHFGVSPAAISKRLAYLKSMQLPPFFEQLTEKEKKFVLEKAGGSSNVRAALSSFDCTSPESAKSLGAVLMKKEEVGIAITDLLAQEGLSRRSRAKKLFSHMNHQSADVSLKAIEITNKMSGDYREVSVNLNIDFKDLKKSAEETQAEIDILEAEIGEIIDVKPVVKPTQSQNIDTSQEEQ